MLALLLQYVQSVQHGTHKVIGKKLDNMTLDLHFPDLVKYKGSSLQLLIAVFDSGASGISQLQIPKLQNEMRVCVGKGGCYCVGGKLNGHHT